MGTSLDRLREEDPSAYLEAVLERARREPDSMESRVEAAYALDAAGLEDEAIGHYDAAFALGATAIEDPSFPMSYGCILRSLGRYDESLAILGEATICYPDYVPLRAILALSLHSAGHGCAGMAMMLEIVLQLASGDEALDGYEEALIALQQELIEVP